MKHIKLAFSELPYIAIIDGEKMMIHRAIEAEKIGDPALFVLAAGRQKAGEEFKDCLFGRDVDLSDFYRTEQEFDDHVKSGFLVSDAFFERTEAKRIFVGLSKQGLALITEKKN